MFTPGAVHGLHGDSETGKTWICYIAVCQEVRKGNLAAVIDFEMGGPQAKTALRVLGLKSEDLSRIYFVAPDTPFGPRAKERLMRWADERDGDLTIAVIDSVGESAAVSGLSGNDDQDMAAWFASLPKWIAKQWPTYAAVVIDHLPKGDSEALNPIGSQRKRATVLRQFLVKAVEPFSREKPGHSAIVCAKDHSGYFVRRQVVAQLDAGPEGMRLGPPTTAIRVRVTTEQNIARYLHEHPDAATRAVVRLAGGNAKANEVSLEAMVSRGEVARTQDGRARRHRLTETGMAYLVEEIEVTDQ